MNHEHPSAARGARSDSDEETPGVPGFRSWRAVYVFVFTLFVAMVIALAIFSRIYG